MGRAATGRAGTGQAGLDRSGMGRVGWGRVGRELVGRELVGRELVGRGRVGRGRVGRGRVGREKSYITGLNFFHREVRSFKKIKLHITIFGFCCTDGMTTPNNLVWFDGHISFIVSFFVNED
jgi:hypothetical protein